MSIHRLRVVIAALLTCTSLAMLAGCNDPFSGTPRIATTPLSAPTMTTALQRQQTELANLIATNAQHARQLQTAVDAFLAASTDTSLGVTRTAWRQAHNSYSALIGVALLNPQDTALFALDAWPIQPGYLDSQPDHPYSGLIHDDTLEISLATLQQQHGFTDSEEVSLGFHALEYLLFARPTSDFQMQPSAATETPQGVDAIARRRSMVALLTQQLHADLLPLHERLIQQQNDINDDVTAGTVMARHIDTAVWTAAQALQAFSNTTLEPEHGHYSGSQAALLRSYLKTTLTVWFEPVNLVAALPASTADSVAALRSAVADASALAEHNELSADDRAQMTLLLANLHNELQAIHATLVMAVEAPETAGD